MRVSAALALLATLAGGALTAGVRAAAPATPAGQASTVGPLPQYEESLPRDHPAVRDDPAAIYDPIAALGARVAAGTMRFTVDARLGVLPALLAALGVPPESQTLAFSKTSFQFPRISPQLPRALYFNDEVAVGVVPGSSVIELATMHPRAGHGSTCSTGRRGPMRRSCAATSACAVTTGWPRPGCPGCS